MTVLATIHRSTPRLNICIVGNIGSGKSTLTRLLNREIPNSVAIPEEFKHNPFLDRYVREPYRWAFTNAVRYFYDYARVYADKTTGKDPDYCFIDAGGATNRHVYGRMLLQEKYLTPAEDAFYDTLCDLIQRAFGYPDPDAYVFVRSTPRSCFARMKKRGWKYQTRHIPLRYLIKLDGYINAFRESVETQGIPVLELDSDACNFKTQRGRIEALERVHVLIRDYAAL